MATAGNVPHSLCSGRPNPPCHTSDVHLPRHFLTIATSDINPHFPALRADALALSGASRRKQIPCSSDPAYVQYSAVTTETKSGAILALIGGRDFSHSRLDRTQTLRDLGSAFELFIAAAAAERDKLILPGRPLQTGRQIGPAEVQRIARRCGINGTFVESEDLFRGAIAASSREMATGLATLGNQGKRPRLFFIREVRKPSGDVIFRAQPDLTQAIGENAARDATTVLAKREGTRCFTGATASEREAWTLRLGPAGSTAIWIGFDKPATIAPEPRLHSLLDEFVQRLGNE